MQPGTSFFHPQVFYDTVAAFLSFYYAAVAIINAVAAVVAWRWRRPVVAAAWLALAAANVVLALLAGTASPRSMPALPESIRTLVNSVSGPVVFMGTALALLTALFLWRHFFVKPVVAWSLLNCVCLALGLSLTDPNFYAIVAKPDNIAIVALLFLLGFFTWLGAYQAVENDDRRGRSLPPLEKEGSEKVLVWPDLVYIELICMVAVTALLIFWGLAVGAPLEEAASSVKTPNPSKAPWYFLGLQEILVYFDPWMAGVVLPSLIVIGLIAIPYLDVNKAGNGYYTIAERKLGYLLFQFGFLALWIALIIMGTFLRGPGWNFFGPYQAWDAHKDVTAQTLNLSQYFWALGLGRQVPKAVPGSSAAVQLAYALYREAPGIVLMLAYFLLLPPLLARTVLRNCAVQLGRGRYLVMVILLLCMMLLPIKMLLHWTLSMKYIIAIPEFLLNL